MWIRYDPNPVQTGRRRGDCVLRALTIATGKTWDTEYLQTISGKPVAAVLAVMDDCMTALKSTYPRLYHATIRRLQG